MNLILEILRESKEQEKFISIWNYSDSETFWFGSVINFTEELVTIQHYTKYGKKDGLMVLRISDISSIDFDDEYTKFMTHVVQNSDKISEESNFDFDFIYAENWQFNLLKQLERKTNVITSVEINGETYSGFINQVEEEAFIISLVGSLGENKGFSIFKIYDITEIKINNQENRKKLLLYNFRRKIQ